MKSIEDKLDILINEIRLLRHELAGSKRRKQERTTLKLMKAPTEEQWSSLRGVMTAREVCISLDIPYSKTTTTALGAILNERGVKRIRTKETRLFDFGNEDVEELAQMEEEIRKNFVRLRGKKDAFEVAKIMFGEPVVYDVVMISKALRGMKVRHNVTTGEFYI